MRGYYRQHAVCFVDLPTPTQPLSALLHGVPEGTEQVYLVGPRPWTSTPGMYAFYADALSSGEWVNTNSNLDSEQPLLRLRHVASDRRIDVRLATEWFDGTYTAAEASEAFARLAQLLQRAWPGSAVMSTPALTGRTLWDLSTHGVDFPVLDPDVRALIQSTSGQGRIELCPMMYTLPGFYYLDGRFMYAALCNELPGQLEKHDNVNEYIPYARARYRVYFQVPKGWMHVGLLGVKDPGSHSQWCYPCRPGDTGETWADGWEVELAVAQGWTVEIKERLVFSKVRPLDTWAHKLVQLRDGVQGGEDDVVAELVRDGLRSIVLRGIGLFARRGRPNIQIISQEQLAGYDLERGSTPKPVGFNLWLVRQPEQLPARLDKYQHPEWSAAIWARARARLLWHRTQNAGALTLPRQDVIAFRTDAIYLARDPQWVDNGKPGMFRLKGAIREPVKAPKSRDALLRLKERAERGDS